MNDIYHVENNIPSLLAFALSTIHQKQFTHALEATLAALKIDPNHAEAHHLASHAYAGIGDELMARVMLKRAITLEPDNPQYHYNAAVNASLDGDTARAMVHYAQALRQSPDLLDALWNYGECLRMDEQFALALNCFERLVQLNATHYEALWDRMSVCYASLDRHEEAEATYQRAFAAQHSGALAHWEYALYKLSQDDFETGFKYYNDRFLCEGKNNVFCHDFPYPLWSGAFKNNETLLIHGEQGFGDELMFASLFNELLNDAEKMSAQVIIACKPGLARLFSDNFPRAQVRTHLVGDCPADLSDVHVDAQLPMGDLMHLYRKKLDDFTAHRQPYFKADPERTSYYAERIQRLGREAVDGKRRFRVGLMWGSNPAAVSAKFSRWTHQRSIPLHALLPLADMLDDVEFISLQNQERGSEAATTPQLDIVDFSLDQADFYDTAALIDNLDLVISVDTSVSHLAGGMGVPTWVPLMKRADWRHGRTREHSIWYDQTRYFRQTQADDWRTVIQSLHDTLHTHIDHWKTSA